MSYIEREIETLDMLKVLRAWWPHYKWLKKNNVNLRHFKQQKEFNEIMLKLKITKRLQDVHLSRQAIEVAKSMADLKAGEERLDNARAKKL